MYKSLSVTGPRGKRITPRQRGCMQAVVTGAVTHQRHLAAAGLVESAVCPFCDTGEEDTEEHAYWRCPAWADIRAKCLGAAEVDFSDLPRITQTCAIVTKSAQDQRLGIDERSRCQVQLRQNSTCYGRGMAWRQIGEHILK